MYILCMYMYAADSHEVPKGKVAAHLFGAWVFINADGQGYEIIFEKGPDGCLARAFLTRGA